MNAKDLLGKQITEIHLKVSEVKDTGSIPLEEIEVQLKLGYGELVDFPHHPEAQNIELRHLPIGARQIFPAKGMFGFGRKKSIFNKLEDKKIIGLWEIHGEFSSELCALEFINGYFLVKGPTAPIGTGEADLFIFESQQKMELRFRNKNERVYSLIAE